jgi:hypothetical protein
MRNRTVMGIFDRPSDAEKVKDELLEAGIARHRIVISRLGTDHDIESDDSIVGEVHVEVVARSPLDRQEIARLMLRHGARETVEARA